MATDVLSVPPKLPGDKAIPEHSTWLSIADDVAGAIVSVMASLRLTVVLFGLGIFIILVGTLAQVEMNMWQVIDEYFRSWVATIPFQVFFPRSWFPKHQNIPFGFWFPGGAAIGTTMIINLFAAHLVRFKSQAKGTRLISGLLVILGGAVITAFVIASGHNKEGLQAQPPFGWQTLWLVLKIAMGVVSAAAIYGAFALRRKDPTRLVEQVLLGGTGLLLGMITTWTIVAQENAYMGDSGMRILWQLIQATFCGLVLLAGCIIVFRKRGGIVLIHAGVALMMFGQFFVSKYDVEEQMHIEEGESRSYAEDIRQTELAVIDASHPDADQVVIVPKSMLLASRGNRDGSLGSWLSFGKPNDQIIRNERLPFDIQVVEYYPKAEVRDVKPDDTNLATTGLGQRLIAVPEKPASGTDSESPVDLAATYVRLTKKGGGDLGTYMLSQYLTEQVTLDGKPYDLTLRFRRSYKPYQITLNDVRKDDYLGTSKPRNYSSDVRLVDTSRGVDRDQIHIWMNNPLRYAGETFYQSGYVGPPDVNVEATTLSVVTNRGWMIPYVSCMIVIVGLGAHFSTMLLRFLRKPESAQTMMNVGTYSHGIGLIGLVLAWLHKRGQESAVAPPRKNNSTRGGLRKAKEVANASFQPSLEPVTFSQAIDAALPLIVILPFAFWFLAAMWPPRKVQEFDLTAFGRIPVIADGRVKPMDTLARNTLRVISNKETLKVGKDRSLPAINWLLDVIADPDAAAKHEVFRIDNLEVLDLLGLKRRKGKLYSIAEIREAGNAYTEQLDKAQHDAKANGMENLSPFQRKLMELDRRIHAYLRVAVSFQSPPLPELPTIEEFDKDRAGFASKLSEYRDAYQKFARGIEEIQPPLVVPIKPDPKAPKQTSDEWQAYSVALPAALVKANLLGEKPPDNVRLFAEMIASYSRGDAKKFNRAVEDYHSLLDREKPTQLAVAKSFWNLLFEFLCGSFYGFEEFFNRVSPFFLCRFPYLFAGVLAATSWLVWREPLRRSAWWLTVFAFALHTLALGARIYISGRPPVTNLYSSAIFIGWAAVLFCLVWEWLNRNGIAIFISSLLGFASLIIAHTLAADGDTFIVLEAVLDTQFWLATHVVCVTLGYSTTFLAGVLGVFYVVRGLFTRSLTKESSREMARMIYGTTCFGLFFSFFGTVLGGLWADDSWGRFWGWDPKENGALIIVMWNALVLHARWAGMVKDRGLAVLSIFGNVVTSWSWFGVNELGVGLHSYGFTEGVLYTWFLFVSSQLFVIVAGCMPKYLWRSSGGSDDDESEIPIIEAKPA